MKLFSKQKINDKIILNLLGLKISFKLGRKKYSNVDFKTIYKSSKENTAQNTKKVLIYTYSLGFLYTQLAVAKHLFKDCEVDIILSSFSDESTKNILELVKDMDCVNKLSLISKNYIDDLEKMQYETNNSDYLNKIKNKLCKDFNSTNYDSVIYVFDIADSLVGILKAIFPNIELIITGDAMGFYYEKEAQKQFYGHEVNYDNVFEFVKHDLFINILPVQIYKKNAPEGTQVKVLPQKDYLEIFTFGRTIYKKLTDYSKNLLARHKGKTKCILMTENFAQCGMITEENEIKLYCDTIKKYCPKNSVIFIKPHPLENGSRINRYKEILSDDWELVQLDKKFIPYPIEMMHDLIESSDIVISAGTPRITIKYLYNKDVICPFQKDRSFIIKYFDKNQQANIDYSIKIIEESLKAIENWDKKSFLREGIIE